MLQALLDADVEGQGFPAPGPFDIRRHTDDTHCAHPGPPIDPPQIGRSGGSGGGDGGSSPLRATGGDEFREHAGRALMSIKNAMSCDRDLSFAVEPACAFDPVSCSHVGSRAAAAKRRYVICVDDCRHSRSPPTCWSTDAALILTTGRVDTETRPCRAGGWATAAKAQPPERLEPWSSRRFATSNSSAVHDWSSAADYVRSPIAPFTTFWSSSSFMRILGSSCNRSGLGLLVVCAPKSAHHCRSVHPRQAFGTLPIFSRGHGTQRAGSSTTPWGLHPAGVRVWVPWTVESLRRMSSPRTAPVSWTAIQVSCA